MATLANRAVGSVVTSSEKDSSMEPSPSCPGQQVCQSTGNHTWRGGGGASIMRRSRVPHKCGVYGRHREMHGVLHQAGA